MQGTLIIYVIYLIIFLWNYVKFLNLRLIEIGNILPTGPRKFSIYSSNTYLKNYVLLAIKNLNLSNFWEFVRSFCWHMTFQILVVEH